MKPTPSGTGLTAVDVHRAITLMTSEGAAFEITTRDVGEHAYRVYRHAPATLVDILARSPTRRP